MANGDTAVMRMGDPVRFTDSDPRIELEVSFGETTGMPGYGSISTTTRVTAVLPPGYICADKAAAIVEIFDRIANQARERAQLHNTSVHTESVRRALQFQDRKLKLQLDHINTTMEEGAARDAARRKVEDDHRRETGIRQPAPAVPAAPPNGVHHAAPDDWSDIDGGSSPPAAVPHPALAASQPAPAPVATAAPALPPLPGTVPGPPTQSSYSGPVQWDRGEPRTGSALAGGMKNQPKEVKDRVRRLMLTAHKSQPTAGWARVGDNGRPDPVMWKELSDDKVSWIVACLRSPESASHRNAG